MVGLTVFNQSWPSMMSWTSGMQRRTIEMLELATSTEAVTAAVHRLLPPSPRMTRVVFVNGVIVSLKALHFALLMNEQVAPESTRALQSIPLTRAL